MGVFNFHARASLNRLIRKILSQISSLATKIPEPGDEGADSYPIPPRKPLKAPGLQGGSNAPERLRRVQAQPAPWREAHARLPTRTSSPQYLMLPFGGRLLFHFRHKHTRHFPLHRAQAPHGGPNRQWDWKANL